MKFFFCSIDNTPCILPHKQILALLALIACSSAQTSVSDIPPDATSLAPRSDAAAGWIIFVAFFAILLEVFVVVMRFLNVQIINANITYFLIAVSSVCKHNM